MRLTWGERYGVPPQVRVILENFLDGRAGRLVAVRPQMAVRVERRLRRGVPQPGLHRHDVGARRDQQRHEVMPEIVVPEGAGSRERELASVQLRSGSLGHLRVS
jgi:hypothetical protein